MLSRDHIEKLMREGAAAFGDRMRMTDCPYRPGTAPFATWTRGYQNAAFGAAQLEKQIV